MESNKKNKAELNKQSLVMKQITEIENMLMKKILQNRDNCINITKDNLVAIEYYKKIISPLNNSIHLHHSHIPQ